MTSTPIAATQELDADTLLSAPREELDRIFRESPPGPIPTGRTRGTAVLFAGSALVRPLAAIARALFWKGKVFRPETQDLKNLLTPFAVQGIRATVYQDESWFSKGPAIIIDYSKTSFVAGLIRDEIREVRPGFYLGQVFWGRKRIAHFMLELPPRGR